MKEINPLIEKAKRYLNSAEILRNRNNSTGLDNVFVNFSVVFSNISTIYIKTTNTLSNFLNSSEYGFNWAA